MVRPRASSLLVISISFGRPELFAKMNEIESRLNAYKFLTFPVGEDEIIQPDLSTEQLVHVDFVGIERTEQDLPNRNTSSLLISE